MAIHVVSSECPCAPCQRITAALTEAGLRLALSDPIPDHQDVEPPCSCPACVIHQLEQLDEHDWTAAALHETKGL